MNGVHRLVKPNDPHTPLPFSQREYWGDYLGDYWEITGRLLGDYWEITGRTLEITGGDY